MQTIYGLFYQYYQYYHISNFPEHYKPMYFGSMTSLNKEYYKKSNENIVSLSNYFSNNYIRPIYNYTLVFNNSNKTMVTSSLSML